MPPFLTTQLPEIDIPDRYGSEVISTGSAQKGEHIDGCTTVGKARMRRFRAIGLLLAVLVVAVYVVVATQRRRTPELASAINVLLGVFGLQAAIRLFGFALSDQLDKFAAARSGENKMWRLSSEDAGLLVIGGIALAWVSVQTILDVFF